MKNWIQDVLAILQLTPQILQLILAVEQIFGSGQGPAKKAFIMNTVTTAGAPPEIMPKVSDVIDHQVSALNAAGKLPKPA